MAAGKSTSKTNAAENENSAQVPRKTSSFSRAQILAEPDRVFPAILLGLVAVLAGVTAVAAKYLPGANEEFSVVFQGAAIGAIALSALNLLSGFMRIKSSSLGAKFTGLIVLLLALAGGGLGAYWFLLK